MRTASVEILGKDHLLCMSTRAKCDIEDRWGSLEAAFDALKEQDNRAILRTTFELLEIMMRSGAIYAKRMGIPNAEPLTSDDLFDLVGAAEIPELVGSLRSAIVNGAMREVEAEPSKNSQTTPPQL